VRSFVAWLSGAALTLGGPGLFVVAALDSSFVSLPQINDLLVVLNVTQNKHLVLYYAAMATLGSVTGCFLLYYVAGKGGEAYLRNRTSAGGLDRHWDSIAGMGCWPCWFPRYSPARSRSSCSYSARAWRACGQCRSSPPSPSAEARDTSRSVCSRCISAMRRSS
jgi:hypothetical protein